MNVLLSVAFRREIFSVKALLRRCDYTVLRSGDPVGRLDLAGAVPEDNCLAALPAGFRLVPVEFERRRMSRTGIQFDKNAFADELNRGEGKDVVFCVLNCPAFKADDFVGVGLDPDGLAVQVAHSEYGYDRNQPVPRYRDESFGCRRRFADEVGYRDARDRLGWKRDRGQPDVWFQFDRDDMRWDGAACVGGVRSERASKIGRASCRERV